MKKRVVGKIGVLLFSLLILSFALYDVPQVQAVAGSSTCTPSNCTVNGQSGICCLIGKDTMTCKPCGAFKAQ